METSADWADVPPGQVGPSIVDDAAAEDDAESINANLSSGLSDVVGEIDIHVDEEQLLESPPPSVSSQDSQPSTVVPFSTGILPTDLPSEMLVIDERVTVPVVPISSSTIELQMIPNDFKKAIVVPVKSEPADTTTTTTTTTKTTATISAPPSTTPQVILTHSKPSVLANLESGRPSLAPPPALIGNLSDYAASIPSVAAWKYVPNPDGTVRMPFRGLEQHVRQRLSQNARTQLQMSAHRKFSNILFFCILWVT